jgi:hypothetical protein
MTPNIDIVGSLKLIAYAPLEYGYKVSTYLFRQNFEKSSKNVILNHLFVDFF